DYNDPATFEHALKRVVMWGPAPGAYGNISYIKFKKNNQVELGSLELLDNDPWVQWNTSEATYNVRAQGWEMVVDITTNGGTTSYILKQNYEWFSQWVLVPADAPNTNPYMNGYTDYPSECEA
ncbi:MAG: hypothetical protein MJK18_02895, partial [Bdellovibrionales bacterium]|nr:hypothetical protein [Bdellovibrionales bacterium]